MTTDRTRREVLRALGLAGAALLLPAWTRRVGAAAGERVRIGLRRASFSAWPVELAAASGGFRDAGLAVELSYFADELAAARALAGGALDAAVLPLPQFYAVHFGTADFAGGARPLATYQVALVNGASLVVPAASTVRYSRQFEGRVFGLTTRLSMQSLLLKIYLQQSGLDPARDVSWEVLDRETLKGRFLAGSVHAAALEEWLPSELVLARKARVMTPFHRLWLDYPAEVIAVGSDFAAGRADTLARLSQATLRAARELERGTFGGLPAGLAAPGKRAAWRVGMEASKAGFAPFPFLSAARLTMEEMKKGKAAPEDVDFKTVAEATCLTGLCREQMRAAGFAEVPGEDSREERLIGCCYTGF
ncbi:MAG TPA: ABC transporter substrate-binding protein [bacterium]